MKSIETPEQKQTIPKMCIWQTFLFEDAPDFRQERGISRTLLVSLGGQEFGGLETHVLNLYKQLSTLSHRPLLLVAARSLLHRRAVEERLSFYAARWSRCRGFRHLLPFVFNELCKRHRIHIIHCNNRFEVRSAVRAATHCSAKVILNYHVPTQFDTGVLEGVDAFISPGPDIVGYVRENVRANRRAIQHIQVIPPLFDAEKFLGYRSDVEPAKWFAATFGIAVRPCPILCTIGNMVTDLEHKNYPLLLQAMALLIHDKETPVQAMLAGDGPIRPYLQELAKNLGIQDYVHFLGYTHLTPGVLHHSDIFVLASSREAFGIVYLEAGLMRKPAIGARNTGAEIAIVPEKTGLLFDNGSASSLADAIRRLVQDPGLAHTLGGRGYERVTRHFVPSAVIKQYDKLYTVLAS